MKAKLFQTKKYLAKGDRIIITKHNVSFTFIVMASQFNCKGLQHTYWILPMVTL